MSTSLKLLACSALVATAAAWPIKTIDESNSGALCDTSTEQYLQVEAYDYHDRPKVTMTWRQTTGPCGGDVGPADLKSWTATYDSGAGDDLPDDDGRVQLNLFVCSPFGEYELELDVESESDADSTLEGRTSWEIENGPDQYHIWDTVNTELQDDEAYSPTVPGVYTWPIAGETGYYSVLYAGPLPPLECSSSVPSGTEYEGCFVDSSSSRLFDSDSKVLKEQGPDGMTTQICSTYCSEYDYFGVEFGSECFCGTAEEFAESVTSDQCGLTYQSLCTGDATTACGGRNAISVYHRTDVIATPNPTPSPVDITPTYTGVGCYIDSKSNRVMSTKTSADPLSAEICFGLCNNGANTHFGTEFSNECWCAESPELTTNGAQVDSTECDMTCASASDGELCGGRDRITAYEIGVDSVTLPPTVAPTPIPTIDPTPALTAYESAGCFVDSKANRIMSGKTTADPMSSEICYTLCSNGANTHFGTQFANECWCAESPVLTANGVEVDSSECNADCASTAGEKCGGTNRMSAYEIIEEFEGPTYIGCYRDAGSPRAMDGVGKYTPGDMTNELCIEHCSSNGFTYAGTQYFNECWCGESFDMYGVIDEENCSSPCQVDAEQICGGSYALSVYQV